MGPKMYHPFINQVVRDSEGSAISEPKVVNRHWYAEEWEFNSDLAVSKEKRKEPLLNKTNKPKKISTKGWPEWKKQWLKDWNKTLALTKKDPLYLVKKMEKIKSLTTQELLWRKKEI